MDRIYTVFDALNINIATHQQINQIVLYCILKVFFASDTTLKKENRVMCHLVLAPEFVICQSGLPPFYLRENIFAGAGAGVRIVVTMRVEPLQSPVGPVSGCPLELPTNLRGVSQWSE